MNYHIIHRTGSVFDAFNGTLEAAQFECDRRNETDADGTSVVFSSFQTEGERDAEIDRMINE